MTIERNPETGQVSWNRDDFTEYHLTGIDVYGKRYKRVVKRWEHVWHYNIYRGTCWGVKPDGKRVRLVEYYN